MTTQADLEAGSPGAVITPEINFASLPPLLFFALREADRVCKLGVRESPPKSNRGPFVDKILIGLHADRPSLVCLRRYLGDAKKPCPHCDGKSAPTSSCIGAPWCARFARWCYEVAAEQLGIVSPFKGYSDLAGSYKWEDFGERVGRLITRTNFQPGDVGLIIDPPLSHVVVGVQLDGKGNVFTYEGNTRDEAAPRLRPLSSIKTFVRVAA